MSDYRTFGRTVRCAVPLQRVPAARGGSRPDYLIEVVEGLPEGGQFRGTLPGIADISIDGQSVFLAPATGVPPFLLASAILGPILGTMMVRDGLIALHASSFQRAGRAWVFMGPSGAGKSSIVATLLGKGDTFLADDVVVIERGEAGPAVVPAFPELRLWDGAPSVAHAQPVPLGEGTSKLAVDMTDWFAHQPVPIGGIFVLDRAATPSVSDMSVGERFVAMLRNTWESQLLVGQPDLAAQHLDRVCALIGEVPVRRLVLGGETRVHPPELNELLATRR